MQDWAFWGAAVALVNVLLAGAVTIHAVLWKRDARAVIAWVALAWLAPLLGSCAYLCLGINRIQRKAESLKIREAWNSAWHPELSTEDLQQAESLALQYPNLVGLAKVGQRLTELPLTPGNHVEPLVDGDEAYPAMIAAIDQAERSVSLLSYICDNDAAGERFLAALSTAEQRGIEVRVLIDDMGSKYSRPSMVSRLAVEGITVAAFLPTHLPRLPTNANMRNHRKILVVDGQVGFTGGTNIRAGHCLTEDPEDPVQCLHFQLLGPVVTQLQRVFAIDWAFTAGEELYGENWFPRVQRAGSVWARGIEHGPDENFEKLVDVIAAALASARRRVRIFTPYFLPRASLIAALNVAALRGVEVEVYLPASNNIALVQWASTAQLWQILEKGCRVFYTSPPFDHTKLMIVDDVWTLVGSTNWDPRSLRLNFEFNVECYSAELAARLHAVLENKVRQAREVTLEEVNQRALPMRLRDGLARLATPYL